MKYDFECVVVGAGIAGMTAAIYLKRAGVKVLILDCDAPGGLLNKITVIENYPGYLKISGPELAYKIYEQVQALDIEIRYGKALKIEDHIITTDVEKISANKIILATGRKAKTLDILKDYKNVSYCALCDGNLYKDKVVAIIGGGNSALEEALYLKDLCQKVILLTRSTLKGEESLQKSVLNCSKIEVKLDCVVKTVKGNDKIEQLQTNQGEIQVDGVFVSIGYEPYTEFINEITKENGYIKVNNKMKTNVDYIYACGDSIQKEVYQLTTAIGEATLAAIQVKKELDSE